MKVSGCSENNERGKEQTIKFNKTVPKVGNQTQSIFNKTILIIYCENSSFGSTGPARIY